MQLVAELGRKIEEQSRPFAAEIDRLDAVPGVDRRVAEVMLAERGPHMEPFPTHENLASWAGCVQAMKKAQGSAFGGASRQAIAG
jgi:transposase